MKKSWIFALPFLCVVGCANTTARTTTEATQEQAVTDSVVAVEDTVSFPRYVYEIPVPAHYERVVIKDSTSFAYFLQHLALKPKGTPVYYYDGSVSSLTDVSYAVIDGYDLGTEDVQQCADWIIRLRAEWLYSQKRYDDIAFHFTNGWLCEYKRWAEGERVSVKGNHTSWYKATTPDYSYATFRKYLNLVFNYAGTLSLSKELEPVDFPNIKIGDVFINGGSPGHAMIIIDMASNGETVDFIVAEGYMPAQDMHILINNMDENISPWFSALRIYLSGEAVFPTYFFSSMQSVKRFKK